MELPSNVHFQQMSRADVAGRLKSIGVKVPSEGLVGMKAADFKPLYGALFEKEVEGFSHWGFMDIDMVWGNVDAYLTDELLLSYDIITCPDGYLAAAFLAGQFTVFRNMPYFRSWHRLQYRSRHPNGNVYPAKIAKSFSMPGLQKMDEIAAVWLATRHPEIRILFDFTRQFHGIGDGAMYNYSWVGGRVLRVAPGNPSVRNPCAKSLAFVLFL